MLLLLLNAAIYHLLHNFTYLFVHYLTVFIKVLLSFHALGAHLHQSHMHLIISSILSPTLFTSMTSYGFITETVKVLNLLVFEELIVIK